MKNMKKRIVCILLAVTMLLGVLPAGILAAEVCEHSETKEEVRYNGNKTHTVKQVCVDCGESASGGAEAFTVDFMADAKRMAQLEAWDDMKIATYYNPQIGAYENVADARYVGSAANAAQLAAAAQVHAWVEENCNWRFANLSSISADSKRVTINAGDELAFGLRLWTIYINTGNSGSQTTLYIDAPAAGIYDLELSTVLEDGTLNYDGGNAGGVIDIYINGTPVLQDHSFNGKNEIENLTIEDVELQEGQNAVMFYTVKDKNGNSSGYGDAAIPLRYMAFTPSSTYTEDCVDEDRDLVCDVCGGELPEEEKDEDEVYPDGMIVVDFKSAALKMAQEDFWNDLRNAKNIASSAMVSTVKGVGRHNTIGSMTAGEKAAYEELLAWLEENAVWGIDEERSKLKDEVHSKRVLFNTGNEDWGLRLSTGSLNTADHTSRVYLTVQAEEAGTYSLDLSVYRESKVLNYDGSNGGGIVDVYVNDQLVLDDYATLGSNETVVLPLGNVELLEGENSVVFHCIADMKGNYVAGLADSERAVALRGMVFTKVEGSADVELPTQAQKPETAEPFKVDFKHDVANMKTQSWWQTLQKAKNMAAGTYLESVSGVGNYGSLDKMTADELLAYDSMLAWLAENTNWNINEGKTDLKNASKRLLLNAGGGDWGLRIHTGTMNTDDPSSSLYLTMDAPAGGVYDLELYVFKQTKEPNLDHGNSGGYASIYVGDTCVLENYYFMGENELVRIPAENVALEKGENEIRVKLISDWKGAANDSERAVALHSMHFTPVETELELQVGSARLLDLRGSYVAQDAVLTAAVSSDEDVVTASVDEQGNLLLTAVAAGEAQVEVTHESGETVSITVKAKYFVHTETDSISIVAGKTRRVTPGNVKAVAMIHQASSSNEAVARAAISGGKLKIEALKTGFTTITVSRGGDVGYALHVKVEPYVAPTPAADLVDFAADTADLAQQPLWESLTYLEGSDTVKLADDSVSSWLEEFSNWNIRAGVALDPDSGAVPSGSNMRLTFQAPAAGSYRVELSCLGQAQGSVEINTDAMIEDGTLSGTLNLGEVFLMEGENTLKLSLADANGFGLDKLAFVPISEAEPVQVLQGRRELVTLQGLYLPEKTEIGQYTYETDSTDAAVATAAFDTNGKLKIYGHAPGTTEILVKDGELTICFVEVAVTGREELPTAQTIEMDFIRDVREMAQQSWWNELKATDFSAMKVIGSHPTDWLGAMDAAQNEAYDQMRLWLDENKKWNFDETQSGLANEDLTKSVTLNAGAADYGLLFYSGKYLDQGERSTLYFTVDADATGLYSMELSAYFAIGSYVNINNVCAGGYADIYVNGELVRGSYGFHSDPAGTVTVNLGLVELDEGENTIAVNMLSDRFGGATNSDRAPALRHIRFTPVEAQTVAQYTVRTLNLNESFLPFDEKVTAATHEAVSSDEAVVSAGIDKNGKLALEGVEPGAAKVSIVKNGRVLCTVDVIVTTYDGDLDGLGGNPVKADVSGFDGQTLTVQIPADGLYAMKLQATSETVDIYVNHSHAATLTDADGTVRNLGAVTLKKGANTVSFDGSVELKALTFVPLGTWQAEKGRDLYLDLNDTYLAFDESVDGFTVKSSDETVATAGFDDGALVISGVKPGQCTLTVTGGGETITIAVQVIAASDIREITYTLDGFEAATLQAGETAAGHVFGLTDNQVEVVEKYLRQAGAVYFSSSDTSVATVDQSTGDVTCVGEGQAVITAYVLLDGVTKSVQARLVVTDDTDLESIAVSAEKQYLGIGNSMALRVSGLKSSGVKADMGLYPVAWSVDDEAVATVSEDGRLTAHQAGTVTVTATAGVMRTPVTGRITVEVVENELLAGGDIYLDFANDRVTSLKTATLENDGMELDREKTYNAGESFGYNNANGMYIKLPAGESFVLNFNVARDGWYQMEIAGTCQASGGQNEMFIDNSYMGFVDFADGQEGMPWAKEVKLNTVYLEAGVHSIQMQAVTEGTNELGWYILRQVEDPTGMDIEMQIDKDPLLAGMTAGLDLRVTDANGNAFYMINETITPEFTNYYRLTSSNSSVLKVSGSKLEAVGVGAAVLSLEGEINGLAVTRQLEVSVTGGTIVSAELTAEKTTFKPDEEGVQLTFTALGADDLPAQVDAVTYASENIRIATVDEQGYVTLTGETGSAKISAAVMDGSREITAEIWLTVTVGKTEPTLYTMEERATAQENVLKYSWAWEEKEAAVKLADLYVENVELLYNMWIREGLPRNTQVGYENDPNYRNCRYCGTDLVALYSHYPWKVDPINNPWKITCPVCDRDFPSNDFESYYKSGLDERGYFHAENADPQYLINELYPEMGDGWGVDNGWGYQGDDGVHTYINYYLQVVFRSMSTSHGMNDVLTALAQAYMYTGDEKYGSAGAILTDRMADIYPEYDFGLYSIANYANADGGNGCGKIIGAIWESDYIGPVLAQAVDAFWPAMDNPDVIEFLQANAAFKGMEPEDITPAYVRSNAETGILLELKKALEERDCYGNFGMHQEVAATVAVVLDRQPESQQLIDWMYNTSVISGTLHNYRNSGGDVSRMLVEDVCRDGFGYEVSYLYNSLWPLNLIYAAEALEGYDKVEGASLWENQKYVNMFSAMTRLSVCGRLMAQTGEAGSVQATTFSPSVSDMTTAFVRTGSVELAQCIYYANGNSTEGIHGDIFTKNPESGIRNQIQQIIKEEGEYDASDSNMMSGFGIAILREGPDRYLEGVNDHEFSDYWMYFGRSGGTGHEKYDALAIDFEGFGIGLSSTMGYPMRVVGGDPEREQWIRNTTSHNTVVVNDKGQSKTYGGFPMHFEDAGRVKVMDAENAAAYPETDIYRRTLVTVAAENGVHYAVDFFRILGGSEHVYSFHAAGNTDPLTQGLDLIEQPMGTYAGADVPHGAYYAEGVDGSRESRGGGYSWLYDVWRDDSPDTTFSLDWKIEDFHNRLASTSGTRLRLTMLSEEPLTEVAIADAAPPQNGTNPDHLEYVLIRRSGDEGMDTLFTSIIEPYQHTQLIETAELVDVQLISGAKAPDDKVSAIKTTLVGGRVDYIVYATNSECLYRVDDKFNFMGFAGVCSYENGVLTYAWGNEATVVADVIDNAQPRVSGKVAGFTEGLADHYYMTVEMDAPVSAEELAGRYIYVNNDGLRNGAYRIYGAEVDGSTAVLDLYSQTLVREYVDELNLDQGFKHNISVGDTYSIPLSATFDVGALFTYTTDTVAKTGAKLSLNVGVAGSGVTYKAETLVSGMKFNSTTGILTWTPSRTQTGRYPVTVTAYDADGKELGSMSFVIYAVSYTGSTYDASVCSHSKAVTYTVGDVIETVCPACKTVIKETVEQEIEKFDVVGTSMSLDNALIMNFMVDVNDLDTTKTYTAKITHGDETVEQELRHYNSLYWSVSHTVAAAEMADTVTVEVYDEDGNAVSNVYEKSVRGYAMGMLAKSTSTAKLKTLCVDLLNYGAAAQKHFGVNTDDLANKELTEAQKALGTQTITYTNKQVKGKNFVGTTLSLEENIQIKMFFSGVTEGMYAKVSYTGLKVTENYRVEYSDFVSYGSYLGVYVDTVVPADATALITVTMYNADGTVYGEVTDSIESYCARMGQSELNDAIMKFAASARAFLS